MINFAIMLGSEKGIVPLALIGESHGTGELTLRHVSKTFSGGHIGVPGFNLGLLTLTHTHKSTCAVVCQFSRPYLKIAFVI